MKLKVVLLAIISAVCITSALNMGVPLLKWALFLSAIYTGILAGATYSSDSSPIKVGRMTHPPLDGR